LIAAWTSGDRELERVMRADLAKAQKETIRPEGGGDQRSANHSANQPNGGKKVGQQGGDSHEKLLRRLARKAPEFLAAYERGEYRHAFAK
jgi:hypothetical protein